MKQPLRLFLLRYRIAILVAVLLALVTTAVPVVNWMQRPAGSVYTGYSYESVGDIFVYLNLIEQAKEGNVLFKDFFTPEPHHAALFNPLFLTLGNAARVFHLTPLFAWHAARVILLFVFVLLLYRFLGTFFRTKREQTILLVSIFTTGAILEQSFESSTFLLLLYSPMTTLTLIITLLFFWVFMNSLQTGMRWRNGSALVLLGVLQTTIQPYVVLLFVCIPCIALFLGLVFHERSFRKTMLLAAPPLLIAVFSVLYQGLIVYRSPVLRAWAENAILGARSFSSIIEFLGVLGVAAAIGLVAYRKEIARDQRKRFLFLWLVLGLIFLRSPYAFSYRLISALHLPLAFFAASGVLYLWRKTATRKHIGIIFLCALMFVSNATHLVTNLFGTYPSSQKMYMQKDELEMAQWIRQHTPQESVFMSSPAWDTLLAEQAYRQVYATVGWQTTTLEHNIRTSLAVYEGRFSSNELQELLSGSGVDYVVVSPRERASGSWKFHIGGKLKTVPYSFAFDPNQYPFLSQVYHGGDYEVYAVAPSLTLKSQ